MDRPNVQNSGLKVTALTVDELALVLRKSGGKTVSRDVIRQHVNEGAPVNADGTLNLISYAAWLVKELSAHAD